jgi:HK97 gp10 family phage protein
MGKKTFVRIKFNNLDKVAAALPREVGDIVAKGIHDIDAHATAATPRDTGKLANSKSVDIDGTSGSVHWSAEYAGHVNFGTRNMNAQPFATDAAEKVFPSIEAALRELEGRIT